MSGEQMLQDRLQHQAGGFDGLLSLIPAKMYYGEDNSSQWRKKKQTKAEAKAARRAKLDPDSELNRNAKEVMDERAKNKRKAREMEQEGEEDEEDDDSFEAADGVEAERPGEGLKKKTAEPNKKQKRDEADDEDDWEDEDDGEEPAKNSDPAAEPQRPQTKLSKKEEKKAAKTQKRKEKKAEKKARKEDDEASAQKPENPQPAETAATTAATAKKDRKSKKKEAAPPKDTHVEDEADEEVTSSKGDDVRFSGMQHDEEDSGPSTADSAPQSPTFDTNAPNGASADAASASTSVSSTIPPSEKPKHIKVPTDTSHLRARLAAKIEALRAARKADGPDGKPIRTRQELIESRRAKEAQRKAHKKELRKQAKLDEERKREEALASNSPSVMSPAVERADSPGSYAFGRVSFGDGAQLSHDLSYVLNSNKKKGPSDPKTALLKVQAQKKRMQELDADKRKDIAEKDLWLNARRRVEGDKIRDNEASLKRTIKRKEAGKRKSEKAWKERQKGVESAQKERQKKREDNIKKRREDKLLGKAGKKKGGGAKKKSRPGFEGSLGVGGRRK